jgi:acyl dehydratase
MTLYRHVKVMLYGITGNRQRSHVDPMALRTVIL